MSSVQGTQGLGHRPEGLGPYRDQDSGFCWVAIIEGF